MSVLSNASNIFYRLWDFFLSRIKIFTTKNVSSLVHVKWFFFQKVYFEKITRTWEKTTISIESISTKLSIKISVCFTW